MNYKQTWTVVFCLLTAAMFSAGVPGCNNDGGSAPPLPADTEPKQYGTPFTSVPEPADIILYEINPRAFSSRGNIEGIIPRLDSIKGLGITTIWLMPVYGLGKVKSVNSPYCIKDYYTIDPEFGSLASLREFTQQCHARGIAVIMDWVANHTSWDNAWLAHKDWYTQVNGEIVHPPGTNWTDVADLNYNNSAMRAAMIRAMKYWALEANIDGYRCDAADMVPTDFWKAALDTLRKLPGRKFIFLAEGSQPGQFSAGFDMNFGWGFYNQLKNSFSSSASPLLLFTANSNEYGAIPTAQGQKLRFTTNHDESAWDNSPVVLFNGQEGSFSAFVVSATISGVPLLYNGQETGYTGKVPFFSNSVIDWSANPSVYAKYRRLLSFRKQSKALRYGALEILPDATIMAYSKKYGTEETTIFVNPRSAPAAYILPPAYRRTQWRNVIGDSTITMDTIITLRGYDNLVVTRVQ